MAQNNKITYVVYGETVMVTGPECFDDFEAKADDRDDANRFAFKLNYLQEIIEQKDDEIAVLKEEKDRIASLLDMYTKT